MDKQLIQEYIARRVAKELRDGDVCNLGIGLPTLVANFVNGGKSVWFQSENGFVGLGPTPDESNFDEFITNAGGKPVTIL
ncbi:MAG: succinyl-CoA--3-ketoacid-CoA transferase, partial [Erysipelotrichaceae bacterium]|nr:succinyl-CoA--3-ketoacid-CoA transferase [Erysipelotrichaceae bacterium]